MIPHGKQMQRQHEVRPTVKRSVGQVIRSYRRVLVAGAAIIIGLVIIVTMLSYLYIGRFARYIITGATFPQPAIVGVVLGGGVENGQPRPLLQDRLDTAAGLLQEGKVSKLLVSGDNRIARYNEPEVMRRYLVGKKGIDARLVHMDNAGRSTYETCERAKKVFGLDRAVFISESTHLPRVLYLCRSFGIEAYGVNSDGQSSAGRQIGQRFREVMARTKAVLNTHVIGEPTVLGDKIVL
jgi:vancomycin permeability regulator SanA